MRLMSLPELDTVPLYLLSLGVANSDTMSSGVTPLKFYD